MKIAVLSDIHDQAQNLSKVLKSAKENECEMLFALGDYTTLEIFKKMAAGDVPIYAVFGNMDADRDTIESWVREAEKKIVLRREMNRVNIDEENFALTHFPEIAEKLLKSGMYSAVFYGHTHDTTVETEDETLIGNPGAVEDGSYGIFDTETKEFEIIKI